VAETNARANGVGDKVRCIEAAGFDHPEIADRAPYDLIFANILKGPLVDLAPAMRGHIAPEGHVILSGILKEQADEVIAAYAAEGLRCVDRITLGDWTTITLSP
jgi:ribosomal protein L11 methyltransferase